MGKTLASTGRNRSDIARQRVIMCARTAADNRGSDIQVLDLRRLVDYADYFLIATGTSRRQMHTMADEIERAMSEQGEGRLGIEGYADSRWVLIDYGDFVVHLFDEQTRRYYDLEGLWADAPRVAWNQQGSRAAPPNGAGLS